MVLLKYVAIATAIAWSVHAADPLKDDLGTDVELMIHLDYSQYTGRYVRATTEKNSAKAKLSKGAWTQFRIPSYSYSYIAPYKQDKRFGCFGGAQSQGIMEYIPSGKNGDDNESDDMEKIDMNQNYNRYIFAVGGSTLYPSSQWSWALMSKGKMRVSCRQLCRCHSRRSSSCPIEAIHSICLS